MLPAGVSVTPAGERCTSWAPTSVSSCLMARLSGGWVMCRRAAARPKWRSSATATKYRSERRSMTSNDTYQVPAGSLPERLTLAPRPLGRSAGRSATGPVTGASGLVPCDARLPIVSSTSTSTTGRASASDDRGTASPGCFPVSMPLPPSAASRPGGRQGLEVSSRRPSAAALCISKPDIMSGNLILAMGGSSGSRHTDARHH